MKKSRFVAVVLASLLAGPAFADRRPAIYTLDNPPPAPGTAPAPAPVPALAPVAVTPTPAYKPIQQPLPPEKIATKHSLVSLSGEGKLVQTMTDPSASAPTLIPLVPQSAPAGSTVESKATVGAKAEWRFFQSGGNDLYASNLKATYHNDHELSGSAEVLGGERSRKNDGCAVYGLGGLQLQGAGKVKGDLALKSQFAIPVELGLICVSGSSTFTVGPMGKLGLSKIPGYDPAGIILAGGKLRYYDGNKLLLDLEGGPNFENDQGILKTSGYDAKAGIDFKIGPFVTLGAKAAVSDRKLIKDVDGSPVRVQGTEVTGNVGLALP